jgi:hypothetical protein
MRNFDGMNVNIGKISATIVLYSVLVSAGAEAQSLKDLMKTKGKTDSTQGNNNNILNSLNKSLGGSGKLSAAEVADGLKAALDQGVTKGVQQLSAADGYLGNAAVKILLPPEARKVEQTLRSMGLGRQVDQAITSMNRAAEDAAKSAAPIFVNAIKGITIQDAFGILGGKEDAATQYLKGQTVSALTESFRPIIQTSLDKVDATKHWNTIFSNYNRVATEKINPDLPAYVTERALNGLFFQLAQEEANIRRNPAARSTDLLKKVFSNQ